MDSSDWTLTASALERSVWTLRLEGGSTPPKIEVSHAHRPIPGVKVEPADGAVTIVAELPREVLSDGLQSVHAVDKASGVTLLAVDPAAAAPAAPAAAAPAPIMPIFHVPFNVGKGGCCADINAIAEFKGVKHLFKQSGGVKDPTSTGLGFAHYTSDDFVRWKYVSTIVTPGGADGSLSFLPDGPVILWDCGSKAACKPSSAAGLELELTHDELREQPELCCG